LRKAKPVKARFKGVSMSQKILFVILSCMFMLCLTQGWASADCRDDCYRNCCGGAEVCSDPGVVNCLVDCIKGCSAGQISVDSSGEKSAPNAAVEFCQQQNRNDVRWCNYPKREVQETRECLQRARQKFDACMQGAR